MKEKLSSRKKRTLSSRKWLTRQINDPYVQKAKNEGYRSRAAYKLLEIQEKFNILQPHQTVVDLGAAPGGWTQVCTHIIKSGSVYAIDLQEMELIPQAIIIQGDFSTDEGYQSLLNIIPSKVDVILSDMAAAACGVQQVDHIRIMHLLELVYEFSTRCLKKGGHVVAKVLRGGTETQLLTKFKKNFNKVLHFKPPASRSDSAEIYLIAMDYKDLTSLP